MRRVPCFRVTPTHAALQLPGSHPTAACGAASPLPIGSNYAAALRSSPLVALHRFYSACVTLCFHVTATVSHRLANHPALLRRYLPTGSEAPGLHPADLGLHTWTGYRRRGQKCLDPFTHVTIGCPSICRRRPGFPKRFAHCNDIGYLVNSV